MLTVNTVVISSAYCSTASDVHCELKSAYSPSYFSASKLKLSEWQQRGDFLVIFS